MMVFTKGEWIKVLLPKGYDPCWMPANKQYYATMWAAAIDRGLHPKRAEVVAEAATTKQLYPDILYDIALEADIKSLFD